jgi:hypothetical protein
MQSVLDVHFFSMNMAVTSTTIQGRRRLTLVSWQRIAETLALRLRRHIILFMEHVEENSTTQHTT